MKIFFPFYIAFFLSVSNLYGQEAENSDSILKKETKEEYYLQREKSYEDLRVYHICNYVDGNPDTLYFEDGRRYFFRHTPLSIKSGYTNIFSSEEVDLIFFSSGISWRHILNYGKKGYTLSWLIKNDSLFIRNIKINYGKNYTKDETIRQLIATEQPELPVDTIIARFEKFTGNKFINGLLFIDWLSGDFGVIKKYYLPDAGRDKYEEYMEERAKGLLISFDKGLLIKMEEDKRENKY